MCLVLTVFLLLSVSSNSATFRGNRPDYDLEAPELIQRHGYPVKIHTVTTEDDYILTLHRIPCGSNSTSCTNRPIVFMTHTMWCSSACWVLVGPNKSLPYLLADQGYDVWLGNLRGNVYSRRHKYLTPSQPKFWDFSWHQMGQYDLPACIDYILKMTGRDDMFYIGHSMGATAFFVMSSVRPEYNTKIRLMISVAPIVYVGKMYNSWFRASALAQTGAAADVKYNQEMFPPSKIKKFILQHWCRDGSTLQEFCTAFILFYAGFDFNQINRTILPLIFSHFPIGSSLKTWIHYGQLLNSDKFRQYDHDKTLNIKLYGTPEPPDYDLSKVDVPVSLHYSEYDFIAVGEDIERLNNSLPNVVHVKSVPDILFSHLDFLWGIEVKTVVYDDIINLINEF